MSEQSPYEKLGVTENASFEEIQEAKKRLSQQFQDDRTMVESVEAAYDAIIMERLRLRQEGKIKVPERIRFPEQERVVEAPVKLNAVSANNSPAWLQRLIDQPSKADILLPSAVFSILAIITVLINLENPQNSFFSLITAFGFAATLYFLNRKEQRFGRSLVITMISLVLGVIVGSGLAGIFQSQGLTGSLASEEIAVLVTLVLFWLSSSFLR